MGERCPTRAQWAALDSIRRRRDQWSFWAGVNRVQAALLGHGWILARAGGGYAITPAGLAAAERGDKRYMAHAGATDA